MAGGVRKKTAGLYVHIPFCVKKCEYCDFLSAPASEEIIERYVNLLCEEIEREAVRYPAYRGETVFFGGGTPTVLRAEQIEKVLCKLNECFLGNAFDEREMKESKDCEKSSADMRLRRSRGGQIRNGDGEKGKSLQAEGKFETVEITLECNPGTAAREDLQRLRRIGMNRLSIGLQSAQNEELRKLGRIHSYEDFVRTYNFAREAGFENINVDIMSALPGQTVESYVNSLEKVAALRPEHISAYSLMIEKGTPFYALYGAADEQRKRDGVDAKHLLPSEEEERRMYALTETILEQNGYRRYEISNYALPGYECRHNVNYWKRGNYLGLGLGAASLMENCRFAKTRDMQEYMEIYGRDERINTVLMEEAEKEAGEAAGETVGEMADETAGEVVEKQNITRVEHIEEQHLSVEEQMEEFMFLGLRLMEGVSRKEFQKAFQAPIESIYGNVLAKLERQGLLLQENDRILLTKRGIDVSNVVLAEFLF